MRGMAAFQAGRRSLTASPPPLCPQARVAAVHRPLHHQPDGPAQQQQPRSRLAALHAQRQIRAHRCARCARSVHAVRLHCGRAPPGPGQARPCTQLLLPLPACLPRTAPQSPWTAGCCCGTPPAARSRRPTPGTSTAAAAYRWALAWGRGQEEGRQPTNSGGERAGKGCRLQSGDGGCS